MEDTPDKGELDNTSTSSDFQLNADVPGHADAFSKSLAAAEESIEARRKDTLFSKVMSFLAEKLGGILGGKKAKNENLFTSGLFEKQAEDLSQSPVVDDTLWAGTKEQFNKELGQAA